jgi:hypothetical protein
MPEPEDIISGMKSRKQKLQKYEQSLKQFQYKKALNEAIDQQNPEVVLIHRGALEIALSNRSEDELKKLVGFIKWKISDYRYQTVLLQVLRFVIDMYQGILGTGHSQAIDSLLTSDLE